MNALQRAQQISARLSLVDEARQYEKEAEALQSKLELLRTQRTALQAAVAAVEVLVNNDALDASFLPAVLKAKEAVARVAEVFKGDPRTLTSGRDFNTLLRSLESTTKTTAEVGIVAWKQAISTMPQLNEKLLGRIEQIQSQAGAVRRLRDAATKLATLTKTPPATHDQWNAYIEQRRLVEDLVGSLSADRFPQAVLEFCKRAQAEGAPMSMLTPEVKRWLEQNNIYDDLRLRLL